MANGHLIVQVYADNMGQPVKGANVKMTFGNEMIETTTDSSGSTVPIQFQTPDKALSLTPQTATRPYNVGTVEVTKPGLNSVIINGVQIFPDVTSLQNVILSSESNKTKTTEHIEIPDHTLWGDYPPKIPQNPEPPTKVLPAPIIPEYIIVHDGLPSNSSAPNYYVSFPDYIKNVASSEIYSTWPKETLKANIYAIISFTLNRIFTEWYPSKGYPFTITSVTSHDQKFTYGRTIFDTISDVVDEIFTDYITKGNAVQPFFAQYNDGIQTNNPGWLSQWGSKDLGDKGYTALQILKTYYGNQVKINTAEEIEGIPSSFPGYNLKLGDCNEAVQKIQNELNTISGSYPLIQKISPANGEFKPNTKEAVKVFQNVFHLPVTGIVDYATWYKISYIYTAVSKMLKDVYISS